jgi:DNA-binding response OmpR family regulator
MERKILIIDDNEQDRKIMQRFLTRSGYSDIATAGCASDGLAMVNSYKPDLVVLDTMLPDMVGFDVCAKIREQYPGSNLLIVITTGSIDAVDALRARQAGANDYCVKTADCQPLLDAVRNLFGA